MTRSFSRWPMAVLLALLALGITSGGETQERPNLGQINTDIVSLNTSVSSIDMDLADLMDLIVPVGAVMPFAGPANSIPQGWLLCDGGPVSRTAFPDLFALLGVRYGIGDAVTTFNLPDYRGRFLRGVDAGAGLDPDAASRTAMGDGTATGDEAGTVQGDATALPNASLAVTAIAAHSHSISSVGSHSHTLGSDSHFHTMFTVDTTPNDLGDANGSPRWASQRTDTTSTDTHSHSMGSAGGHGHSSSSAGSHNHGITGGDAETRPVNASVNYIIKH